MIYLFGDCELDTQRHEIRRDGEPRHVEPQVFDVLCHLVEHRDRMVPRDELLDAIWGHRFVAPTTLSSRIKAARQAIGDDGSAQQMIRTIRGRGFRFMAEVHVRGSSAPADQPSARAVHSEVPPPELTGRASELERLHALLDVARTGSRRLAFISGEAGVGKSVLLNAFAWQVQAGGGVRVTFGQCLDQRGPGEPYLPVLDALGRLGRAADGADVIAQLETAPTWLAQLPALLRPDQLDAVQRGAFGATRERMLREMVEVLELLTQDTPLLLIVEDLHWSDPSTLELLSWIAQRPEAARLLVLGSYRSGNVPPDLAALLGTLQRTHVFTDLALEPWGDAELREHLARRWSGRAIPESLVQLLHMRAEGNPLYLQLLLDGWLESGALARVLDNPNDEAALERLAADVPPTLRVLIKQRIDEIPGEEQQILEAGSVAGVEFDCAAIAAAVELSVEEAEQRCLAMIQRSQLLREAGITEGPDESISTRFRFAHHLLRDVLYERIPQARRARLHRAIGLQLERIRGQQSAAHAGELALHFTHGRDAERAVRYLTIAARQALGRSAPREAIRHMRAALDLLARRPELSAATHRELELQRMLAAALITTGGWGNSGAEQAYRRARELSEQLDDADALARVLYGLAYLHEIRGDYHISEALVKERLGIELPDPTPGFIIESHELLSCSLFHQGEFDDALANASRAVRELEKVPANALVATHYDNAALASHYWAGLALWFLGFPERALEPLRTAVELASQWQMIYLRSATEWQFARLRLFRGDFAEAAAHAQRAVVLAERQGYPYPSALARALHARIRVHRGEVAAGIQQLEHALARQLEMGAGMERPYCVALLAEALLESGDTARSLTASEQALGSIAGNARTFFWEAELHRLRGEALARQGARDAAALSMRTALATAARQHALSLELRACMSLCRLQAGTADAAEARTLLAGRYERFTEGHETADLRAARIMLESAPPDRLPS